MDKYSPCAFLTEIIPYQGQTQLKFTQFGNNSTSRTLNLSCSFDTPWNNLFPMDKFISEIKGIYKDESILIDIKNMFCYDSISFESIYRDRFIEIGENGQKIEISKNP